MFQKWCQSKCTNLALEESRKISTTILSGIVLALAVAAVPLASFGATKEAPKKTQVAKTTTKIPELASKSKSIPPLLAEIETKYSKAATLSAEFEQTTHDAVLAKAKKSSGKIFIKRPSKVRWETLKPDKNLLVSDGAHFWYYTPPFDPDERGQVIEKKTSDVQSRLAQSLLSGAFSMNREIILREKSPSVFVLVPKKGTAGTVTQATVEIDPEQKLIRKVILDHKGGNKAEITLSQIRLGEPLGNDLFSFQAPPNTDKINEFSGSADNP